MFADLTEGIGVDFLAGDTPTDWCELIDTFKLDTITTV